MAQTVSAELSLVVVSVMVDVTKVLPSYLAELKIPRLPSYQLINHEVYGYDDQLSCQWDKIMITPDLVEKHLNMCKITKQNDEQCA